MFLWRKIEIFQSVVVSKLLYACSSAWLLKADLKKLDGFFCNCLRKILGIQASFYSRVSNESVLERAKCRKLSARIRESQLSLLDQVLNDPGKKVLRNVAFHGDSEIPETSFWVRRRGRPRQTRLAPVM